MSLTYDFDNSLPQVFPMFRNSEFSSEIHPDTLDRLLNDRVLSRYTAMVGYSSLTKVQECLQYKNKIFQQEGRPVALSDLLARRNSLLPACSMDVRRGFRA